MNLQEKCSEIKAIVLDVDGVLTDGRIGYSGASGDEMKFFDVRDGLGVKMAMRAGLKAGILSGRKSLANAVRAKELELDFIYQGYRDKKEGFLQLLQDLNLTGSECFYIGDDLIDLPPMRLCGVSAAVGDAVPELDKIADFRTKSRGGRGAVREAIEWLLKERGQWQDVIKKYMD